MGQKTINSWLKGAILLLSAIVFIRTAWISDDALITLRTVLNFTHGYGAVFNLGERVQAYTHPLWFLALSIGTAVFQNIFSVTFTLSILISTTVVFLLLFEFDHPNLRSLAWVLVLIFSKAFVDYSTSGLENPLSHLMIVVGFLFAWRYFQNQKEFDAFCAIFIFLTMYLCRPDLILIGMPTLLLIVSRLPKHKRLKYLWIGLTPILFWTALSLVYYGFPFPNTAYAKLNNNIPRLDLLIQGFKYFLDSLQRDPLTLTIVFFGSILSFIQPRKEIRVIGLGILFYIAYTFWIGGDFMSGRFLTIPMVSSVVILLISDLPKKTYYFLIPFCLLAGVPLQSTILSGSDYTNRKISEAGITDERGYYFQEFGLIHQSSEKMDVQAWKLDRKHVIASCGRIGTNGIHFPDTHWVDLCGLTEPLLARMPRFNKKKWRIGHYYRQIPTNYEDTVLQNVSVDMDPQIVQYWKTIHLITSGPLLSRERLSTILQFNLHLIEKPDMKKYADEIISSRLLPEREFEKFPIVETGATNKMLYSFPYAIEFYFDQPRSISAVDISLNGENYLVQYRNKDSFETFLELHPNSKDTMVHSKIKLSNPTPIVQSIRIVDSDPGPLRYIGHLRVN